MLLKWITRECATIWRWFCAIGSTSCRPFAIAWSCESTRERRWHTHHVHAKWCLALRHPISSWRGRKHHRLHSLHIHRVHWHRHRRPTASKTWRWHHNGILALALLFKFDYWWLRFRTSTDIAFLTSSRRLKLAILVLKFGYSIFVVGIHTGVSLIICILFLNFGQWLRIQYPLLFRRTHYLLFWKLKI